MGDVGLEIVGALHGEEDSFDCERKGTSAVFLVADIACFGLVWKPIISAALATEGTILSEKVVMPSTVCLALDRAATMRLGKPSSSVKSHAMKSSRHSDAVASS